MLNVLWGDRLEGLADTLFNGAAQGGDPFVPECVVVGSPVIKGWLKQHFLFERREQQRVLANWEFVPLHQFVNDWLARMGGAESGPRQPALHPYSKECLRWRIYRLLESERTSGLETLLRYVGTDKTAQARRRFGLAGQIARMFDDYQNYRAEMLVAWETGQADRLSAEVQKHVAWQRILWQALKTQDSDSYLAQFLKMEKHFPGKALGKTYRRISVFHVSSMPIPYVHFFELLSNAADVTVYAFNPSVTYWLEDVKPTLGLRLKLQGEAALVGAEEAPDQILETGNPLLSSLGIGCQSYLGELLDRTNGQLEAIGEETPASGSTLLSLVQAQIRERIKLPDCQIAHCVGDPSIQFHICHSPMREVEVLRDQLLAWFKDNPARQPRHVQVLVADLDTYAPFIDAVFQTEFANAPDTIPYEIADRPKPGAGPLGTAYLALLRCCESRFTASELMGLLALDGIREAFGLSTENVDAARELVIQSGIRWGADADHLRSELETGMDAVATWRRGLDRLLLGYAMGRDEDTREPRMVAAGDLGTLRTVDAVEGAGAELTGTLCRFFDDVHTTAKKFKMSCSPADWDIRLQNLLDTFFCSSNTTFAEIAEIRSAIRLVTQTAAVSGDGLLPHDVIAAAIEAQLQAVVAAATATSNKVIFTPMRTMRPTPRPLLYLLGMGEGAFPRRDDRPTFDLMSDKRRRGDRSLRLDDRLAFLEALLCARERLVISYVGRSQKGNEPLPPSTVVAELQQYLDDVFHSEGQDSKATLPYLVTEHRLQAFHPAYFTQKNPLFSFSKTDFDAAIAMCTQIANKSGGQALAPAAPVVSEKVHSKVHSTVRLADLQRFFANPAKEFYKKYLLAKIDDPEEGILSDKEVFEPDGLERYQMNAAILKGLLEGDVGKDAASLLREHGLLPLGTPGEVLVEEHQEELERFLDFTCPDLALTVRKLMTAGPNEKLAASMFKGEAVSVTGNLDIVELPAGPTRVQTFARYADIKPKDRLKAWIAHLLGHAAGTSPFTTVLVGKGKVPVITEILHAVAVDEAKTTLEALLGLWHEGTGYVLPFAPASSYAYVVASRKAGKTTAECEDEGMEAAHNAWHNEHMRFLGEDQDTYLFHAWGLDGPMVDPRFADLADKIWMPYLAACNDAQGDERNGGGDGDGGAE